MIPDDLYQVPRESEGTGPFRNFSWSILYVLFVGNIWQTDECNSESIDRKYRTDEGRRAGVQDGGAATAYSVRAEFTQGVRGRGERFGINQYRSSVNNRNEDPSVNSASSLRIRRKAATHAEDDG